MTDYTVYEPYDETVDYAVYYGGYEKPSGNAEKGIVHLWYRQ